MEIIKFFDKICFCCTLEIGSIVLGWMEIIVDFLLLNRAILHAIDPPNNVKPSELSGNNINLKTLFLST